MSVSQFSDCGKDKLTVTEELEDPEKPWKVNSVHLDLAVGNSQKKPTGFTVPSTSDARFSSD